MQTKSYMAHNQMKTHSSKLSHTHLFAPSLFQFKESSRVSRGNACDYGCSLSKRSSRALQIGSSVWIPRREESSCRV